MDDRAANWSVVGHFTSLVKLFPWFAFCSCLGTSLGLPWPVWCQGKMMLILSLCLHLVQTLNAPLLGIILFLPAIIVLLMPSRGNICYFPITRFMSSFLPQQYPWPQWSGNFRCISDVFFLRVLKIKMYSAIFLLCCWHTLVEAKTPKRIVCHCDWNPAASQVVKAGHYTVTHRLDLCIHGGKTQDAS